MAEVYTRKEKMSLNDFADNFIKFFRPILLILAKRKLNYYTEYNKADDFIGMRCGEIIRRTCRT